MPIVQRAGPYPIEGINLETWLVRFDKEGACSSPKTGAVLLDALAAKPNAPVLFFSHGWNNDFADAVQLYKDFLTRFEQILRLYPLLGPAPLFVGITWPSIWLPSDSGPQMAGALAGSGLAETSSVENAVRVLADALPKTANLQRFYDLIETEQLPWDKARELAGILKPILQPSSDGTPEAAVSEDTILKAFGDLQGVEGAAATNDLGEAGTVTGAGGTTAEPAAAGLPAFLDPRWAVRLASLYLMKDRAGAIGASGVAALLRDMLQKTNAPIHAIGHSFGGKVMLSAIASQPDGGKPVQSLLLLQPAVSHLCFAENVPGRDGPGGYRMVLDRVVKPILSTYSTNDFPLHTIYHRALLRRDDLGELRIAAEEEAATTAGDPPNAYAALGGYGPRGARQHLIDGIPAAGKTIDAAGARIVGLDGSLGRRIDSHGGVANEYTAWALRTLMTS